MGSLFAELRNAHLYRVAAAYVFAAWILLQVFNNVAPLMHLPDWVGTLLLVVLAVGFPVAILFTWAHQLRRSKTPIPPAAAVALSLIAALFIVFALVSYRLVLAPKPSAVPRPAVAQAAAPGLTLAVLPFANMSGDPGQEFFSDGMTEEVNGALANVAGLHVIARTSAFQFKNQDRDVRAVARLIGAGDVIEGSIRKEGARVRVSVQLVRGADGVQLWSQNYDRNLTDIFAIQEDIASSIAAALRVPLGLARGEQLVADRTLDLDSYEEYLRARALYRGRRIQEAIQVLEPAVARDPNYAPARSLLAMTYILVPVYLMNERTLSTLEAGRSFIRAAEEKSENEARQALRLDPRQSEAYIALALLNSDHGNWVAADDYFLRALSLNPNDADAMHLRGMMLADVGRLKDALASRAKLHELEPFVPIYNIMTAAIMQLNGAGKAAIVMLATTPAVGPTAYFRNVYLARGYAAAGRFALAADTIEAISPDVKRVSHSSVEATVHLLRKLAAGDRLSSGLPTLEGELGFAYAHTAEPGRVLDAVERDLALNFGDLAPFESPWLPLYAPVRRTARFAALMRKAGIVDYWRKRQWADRCHPRNGDAFVCD